MECPRPSYRDIQRTSDRNDRTPVCSLEGGMAAMGYGELFRGHDERRNLRSMLPPLWGTVTCVWLSWDTRWLCPLRKSWSAWSELLAVSLKQGAMGLSVGLIYPPSSYSDTRELIALGKGVKEQDAVLVAHIRDEQDQVVQALEELIAVGRESGCRIHVSHLKCSGKRNWGRMSSVLGVLEKAFKEGIDLSFDQYPYTAGCTTLSVLLPGWAVEGGWAGLQKRLAEPEMANKIIVEMGEAIENRGGAVSITIASAHLPKNKRFVGKTLASISKEKGMPGDQAALEMLIEEQLQTIAIFHAMAENDVEQAMAHCLQTVGSDGILGEFPHPRTYGAFPRVIHYYCGVKRLFSLEEAVRKMTSTPAKRLNLKDRGQIAPGFYADLLLFLPERFQDRATFEDPKQFATGLDWVFVNGTPVIEEGETAGEISGTCHQEELTPKCFLDRLLF